MKLHARLFGSGGRDTQDIECEVDLETPPRLVHYGGALFELRSSLRMSVQGGSRLNADYAEVSEIFSLELGREVSALYDEQVLAEEQVRAENVAMQKHAPFFAETLARYIGGLEDEVAEYRSIAERAFNAYNEHGETPWLTFDGRPVPRWDAITEAVRGKWIAAVKACVSAEVHRRRAAVIALEDLQKAFDRDALAVKAEEVRAVREQVKRVRAVLENFDCGHGPNDCPDSCPQPMTDKLKAAVEWLRTVDRDDDDYKDLSIILAHLDAEPERIARAREEQREADARHTYSGAFVSDSTTLRWELDGAVLGEREAWRQTDEMRRQRDEAVAALRFVRGCRSACACHEHARAVLAKYPEVKP